MTVGNPASSYSFPYFSINSQKWGICQMNKKKPIKTMVELKRFPPAAVQPMNVGTAPTSEPGTTANEVTLFKLVYNKLYHIILNNPSNAGMIPKPENNKASPAALNKTEISKAVIGEISPDGIGLCLVRFIIASYFHS